jgi:hypothetical protein
VEFRIAPLSASTLQENQFLQELRARPITDVVADLEEAPHC